MLTGGDVRHVVYRLLCTNVTAVCRMMIEIDSSTGRELFQLT
jgi:hypothetical protein